MINDLPLYAYVDDKKFAGYIQSIQITRILSGGYAITIEFLGDRCDYGIEFYSDNTGVVDGDTIYFTKSETLTKRFEDFIEECENDEWFELLYTETGDTYDFGING